ncbi:hypothetical protein [Nitrosomonas sp.]|uniref:hypothetical protein n=1 Tax=Nitrosomonas sp. TaxID=42353 RepID=UPI00262A1169|nr:hypothetical protein [Nitrosomonas sp.]
MTCLPDVVRGSRDLRFRHGASHSFLGDYYAAKDPSWRRIGYSDQINNLIGSNFNDTLTGNGQNNALYGGAGSDTLNGAGGADTMIGGLVMIRFCRAAMLVMSESKVLE